MNTSALTIDEATRLVAESYEEYVRSYADITSRAPGRFLTRDWPGAQADARERILLYGQVVHETVGRLRNLLGHDSAADAGPRLKENYGEWARTQQDVELAETFFNSVVRRAFATVGVHPELEFAGSDLDRLTVSHSPVQRILPPAESTEQLVAAILAELPLGGEWPARSADAALAARVIEQTLGSPVGEADTVELLPCLFYRNQGAYAVCRILRGGQAVPLVFALVHPPGGICVDAVLLDRDDVSQVFSFTRSYFHADVQHPWSTVHFLRSIMPHKRLDELYTSIGFNRHGKTELFRALMQHLRQDGGRLEPAPGDRGLVMAVFTLPTFDTVFKVIRDAFGHPKRTTRDAVMAKYNFIFVRDRVGRLADAQQFEHLELPRGCFAPELLEELLREAGKRVRVHDDVVLIEHAYTERRVHPLNLYLREAPPEQARRAVVDYGNCIKQLAAANIFPGDMLVKNFGVTRHGRVIFYDYDEVTLLTDVNFRRLPSPASPEDELAADPWYHVGEHDVFPEEFRHFLGLPGDLGQLFDQLHGDLFDAGFWQEMQRRQRAGEVVDFAPYRQELRLRQGVRDGRTAS